MILVNRQHSTHVTNNSNQSIRIFYVTEEEKYTSGPLEDKVGNETIGRILRSSKLKTWKES